MNTKRFLTAIMAVVMAAGLCGCNPLVQKWNTTDEETGYPISMTVETLGASIPAPNGKVSMTYEGGGGFKAASIRLKLVGHADFGEPIELHPDGGAKSATCAAVTGAIILGTAGGTAAGLAAADNFDINLTLGPEVEMGELSVSGWSHNANALANIYGPASYDQPVEPKGYRLTTFVNPANAGTIYVDPDKDSYSPGEEVYVEFVPNPGYRLIAWDVNGTPGISDNEATVRMDGDTQLTAECEAITQPGDTTKPVITLNGSNPMSLPLGTPYVEPGASANDTVSGVCVVVISGTVNTAVAGTYYVNYSATDASGNTETVTRTVMVSTGTTPATAPKMTYGLTANGSLRQEFYQDSCTLQQCWIGFPAGKTWANVRRMGSTFMVGQNPLLSVDSDVNGGTTVTLANSAFAPGFTARVFAYVILDDGTKLFGNTGIVAGYNAAGTRLTRSDGDNYDLSL